MIHISQLEDRYRKCQEICRKCHLRIGSRNICYLSFLCSGDVPDAPNFLCAGNVYEMSSVLPSNIFIYSMPESAYKKCEGNVLEMSCILATGNVPEISCVLVQEMCRKFCPILHQVKPRKCQNFLVQEMYKECELSCTFQGISLLRKFRI